MLRAIVFDAVGTLLHPEPNVVDVYAAAGSRHGSRLDRDSIKSRFKAAFRKQDDVDRSRDWNTSEPREKDRWRNIVAEVFDDEACFAELWDHFAQPTAWRVDVAAANLIEAMRQTGAIVAMASNFDARLHGIVAGLPALRGIQEVIVSSEVGVRKPARAFFAAIERRLDIPATQIVFVGDDPINDGQGAAEAGMRSLLLGRDGNSISDVVERLNSISWTNDVSRK